jgi:hypothetical protein
VIEREADVGRPLSKRVCKRLKAKRLNKMGGKDSKVRERGPGFKSGLEFSKHEEG